MNYLIGVDVGTSNTKAIALSDGKILATYSVSYPSHTPEPGFHEQDPEDLFNAVVQAISVVVEKCRPQTLGGISFSCAMHSVIAVNRAGQPLTPVITWADLRSKHYALRFKQEGLTDQFSYQTGTPLHPMAPLCKIAWLRDHRREVFQATYKFVSIKEYLFFKFFGEYVIDHSLASATGMFDIFARQWYTPALQRAGITAEHLSEPVSTSKILQGLHPEVARNMGISADIPFVLGASDGCLANLGSNATQPGEVAITIGTSGAARMITEDVGGIREPALFRYILDETRYVTGGAINNGGILLKWYAENFLGKTVSDDNLKWFLDEALRIRPGCEGLIFLPYVFGERAPVWDADAQAVFFGIRSIHSQAHFMRAVVEGICYALNDLIQALKKFSAVNSVVATGGFIRSSGWIQMLADIIGYPISITSAADASAVGAAMMASKALSGYGHYDASFIQIERTFEPRSLKEYSRNYAVYTHLYDKLKDDFLEEDNRDC